MISLILKQKEAREEAKDGDSWLSKKDQIKKGTYQFSCPSDCNLAGHII
jgi:hypothetical protein